MLFLRRYGRLLLWFIPAAVAFSNAYSMRAQHPQPFRQTFPIRPAAIEMVDTTSKKTSPVATLRGEASFVNSYPAILRVQVRDRVYGYEPAYSVRVFRDGESYDSMLNQIEAYVRLPEGKHTYRVVAELNQQTIRYPHSDSEMTVLLEYTPTAFRWQDLRWQDFRWHGLSLLGIVFLTIGIFQLRQIRGK